MVMKHEIKQSFIFGLNISKTVKSHLKTKSGVGPTVNSKNNETVEKVRNLVRSDRSLRIQDMANMCVCVSATVSPSLKQNLMLVRYRHFKQMRKL